MILIPLLLIILKVRNSEQHAPYEWNDNPVPPDDTIVNNTNKNNYRLAYLDHGTAPAGSAYEFVCLPSVTTARMTDFAQSMQSTSTKPYIVHQNTPASQIIEHRASKTWAYSLPAININITDGIVKANDTPCLVMYKSASRQDYNQILLSINNPDMGVDPSAPQKVRLTLNHRWTLSDTDPNTNIVSSSKIETVIDFTLSRGMPIEINLIAFGL